MREVFLIALIILPFTVESSSENKFEKFEVFNAPIEGVLSQRELQDINCHDELCQGKETLNHDLEKRKQNVLPIGRLKRQDIAQLENCRDAGTCNPNGPYTRIVQNIKRKLLLPIGRLKRYGTTQAEDCINAGTCNPNGPYTRIVQNIKRKLLLPIGRLKRQGVTQAEDCINAGTCNPNSRHTKFIQYNKRQMLLPIGRLKRREDDQSYPEIWSWLQEGNVPISVHGKLFRLQRNPEGQDLKMRRQLQNGQEEESNSVWTENTNEEEPFLLNQLDKRHSNHKNLLLPIGRLKRMNKFDDKINFGDIEGDERLEKRQQKNLLPIGRLKRMQQFDDVIEDENRFNKRQQKNLLPIGRLKKAIGKTSNQNRGTLYDNLPKFHYFFERPQRSKNVLPIGRLKRFNSNLYAQTKSEESSRNILQDQNENFGGDSRRWDTLERQQRSKSVLPIGRLKRSDNEFDQPILTTESNLENILNDELNMRRLRQQREFKKRQQLTHKNLLPIGRLKRGGEEEPSFYSNCFQYGTCDGFEMDPEEGYDEMESMPLHLNKRQSAVRNVLPIGRLKRLTKGQNCIGDNDNRCNINSSIGNEMTAGQDQAIYDQRCQDEQSCNNEGELKDQIRAKIMEIISRHIPINNSPYYTNNAACKDENCKDNNGNEAVRYEVAKRQAHIKNVLPIGRLKRLMDGNSQQVLECQGPECDNKAPQSELQAGNGYSARGFQQPFNYVSSSMECLEGECTNEGPGTDNEIQPDPVEMVKRQAVQIRTILPIGRLKRFDGEANANADAKCHKGDCGEEEEPIEVPDPDLQAFEIEWQTHPYNILSSMS